MECEQNKTRVAQDRAYGKISFNAWGNSERIYKDGDTSDMREAGYGISMDE